MENNSLDSIKKEILNLSDKYFEENLNNTFIPFISHIPVTGKVLEQDDLRNLISSSLDMWLTSGDFTEEFEKKISEFLNIRHCLFVNSGSSANLLALSSLKVIYSLNDGDEVITSAVNFPTTVNPIIQNGLKPVFVDADSKTYNIDANLIENAITAKTKGIVLAHTLGNPFEINKIKQLCEKHNLFLMEDMCDAFGSKYDGNYVGSFGDVSTLSFYPAHHITTGEGGAVLTNNPKLKKIIESLRDWGRDCYCPPGKDNTCKKRFDWQLGGLPHGYDHKYIYSHIGYNLKATDMQAAIGVSQIEKLPRFIEARKNNFNYLYNHLKDYEMFDMPESEEKADVSWFGFPITINEKANFSRGQLIEELSSKNIGTRFLFGGNILLQPAYIDLDLGNPDDYPVANNVVNNTFWLGVYPGLSKEMLNFVIETINEFIKDKN